MRRSVQLTPVVLGVAAVLVLGASIAFAAVLPNVLSGNQPQTGQSSPKPEGAPSTKNVDRILERLKAAGISTTAEEFNALAAKYGVGGAVRALAFAHAAGKSTADITAMVDAGKGWGEIRRDLNLTIKPGIGWLLGNSDGKPDKSNKSDKANKGDKSGNDSDTDADETDSDD